MGSDTISFSREPDQPSFPTDSSSQRSKLQVVARHPCCDSLGSVVRASRRAVIQTMFDRADKCPYSNVMEIEFDPDKAKANSINHEGVTFDEAKPVLLDPYALTYEDNDVQD